jgi:hypothetical protein
MADGLFIGFQHNQRSNAHRTTDFEIRIDFYENVDWDWITASGTVSGGGSFGATIDVPADTPYGMYGGAVVLTSTSDPSDVIVVPVSVAVAATALQDADGRITGSVLFGGADVAAAQEDLLYNNGSVFGATDWSWRAESGDWRFFFMDVPEEPADGSLLLVNTTWDNAAPYTDLDTLVFGPSANEYELYPSVPFGAPYILDTVANSPNTNIGAGVWLFDTATGGAEDLVAAPVQGGLHAIVQHQVNFQGDQFDVPFEVTVAGASVAPSAVDITTSADEGTFDVTFQAGLDLPGLSAEAFGLSQPFTGDFVAAQDNPNDPSTASAKYAFTAENAASATVYTVLGSDDLDLFLVYDANGDGVFTNGEIVASSTTGTSNEFIQVTRPADGDYEVWVQGWSVSGNPTFQLTVDVVQGADLTVSGIPGDPVPAGTPVTLTVDFSKTMTPGESYFGILQLGPPTAPSAISVPITITKS